MITSSLPAALRAAAEGICTLVAATGLVIASGTWPGRDGTGTAAIDWEAAIGALDAGWEVPCGISTGAPNGEVSRGRVLPGSARWLMRPVSRRLAGRASA
jgi:hypothetical protein